MKERLKYNTVLIAGSGNTTGINLIRALNNVEGLNIIGCDMAKYNPANKFCYNEIVPLSSDSNYFDRIRQLIQKYKIGVIIPSNDHELRVLCNHIRELGELDVVLNGYSDNTIALLDKLATSELFTEHQILTPAIFSEDTNDYPFVVRKNEVGSGKKFVYIVKEEGDLIEISLDEKKNAVFSQFIQGEEYTVDVLCDSESNVWSVVPRLRREVRNGMVHFGEVVEDHEVIFRTKEIAIKLKLTGINCIQCIKTPTGKCYFFEINPRPGSGMDLTINAGVNMPALWIDIINGQNISYTNPDWGLKMIRYYDGYYFK